MILFTPTQAHPQTHATQMVLVVASLLFFVTTSAAQGIDTKLAAQYFEQLKQTSERDGGKTWGLTLYGPIMLVDARSGNIVANQPDLEHKLKPQDGVFVGTLPRDMNPANTAINWAGVHWTWLERDASGSLVRARVPAPTDVAARPLKGEGWSLELANGWEVVPGERPGDVTIRKK